MTMVETRSAADRLGSVSSGNALELRGVTKMFGALAAISRRDADGAAGRTAGGARARTARARPRCSTASPATSCRPPGTIRFFGEDVTAFPPYERIRRGLAAHLPDQPRSSAGLTRVGQRLSRLPRRLARPLLAPAPAARTTRSRTRAAELIEAVHLTPPRDTLVGEPRLRPAAPARDRLALSGAPRLILFDEPAAGPVADRAARTGGDAERAAAHIGYIIIEHDMDVALRVAESVTMMHNGRVFKEGTPEEIENDAEVQELYLGGGGHGHG